MLVLVVVVVDVLVVVVLVVSVVVVVVVVDPVVLVVVGTDNVVVPLSYIKFCTNGLEATQTIQTPRKTPQLITRADPYQ